MIYKLYLVNLIFLSLFLIEDKNNCSNFSSGTFVSNDKITGNTILQRNGNLQLEINEKLGFKVMSKIEWKENCNYILYDFVVIENKYNMTIPIDTLSISIKILNDSTYQQSVFLKERNFIYTSLVTKTDDEAPLLKKYTN